QGRLGQEKHVIRHVQHAFAVCFEVAVSLRGPEGPEQKAIHPVRDLRPHRGDVDSSFHRDGGDNAFENHDSCKAFSRPRALSQVSSYSRWGTESATMPPPTGNCTHPWPIVKVRIRMLVSMVPSKPI